MGPEVGPLSLQSGERDVGPLPPILEGDKGVAFTDQLLFLSRFRLQGIGLSVTFSLLASVILMTARPFPPPIMPLIRGPIPPNFRVLRERPRMDSHFDVGFEKPRLCARAHCCAAPFPLFPISIEGHDSDAAF